MKNISWGTGIVIAIITFVFFTLTTTIFLMNQKVDLVTEDYYKKGLDYQKQIDSEQRTNQYSDQIKINFDAEFVSIEFPASLQSNQIKGEILFYRPSDSELDFIIPLRLDNQKQVIPVASIKKGFWRIKINWNYGNNSYYKESVINL